MFVGSKPFFPKSPSTHMLTHSPEEDTPRTDKEIDGSAPRKLKRITKGVQTMKESLPKGVPVTEKISIQLSEGPFSEKGGRPRLKKLDEKGPSPEGATQYKK